MNKAEYIKEISKASDHYGDKLLMLMNRYGASNLQVITEEQAGAFYREMTENTGK